MPTDGSLFLLSITGLLFALVETDAASTLAVVQRIKDQQARMGNFEWMFHLTHCLLLLFVGVCFAYSVTHLTLPSSGMIPALCVLAVGLMVVTYISYRNLASEVDELYMWRASPGCQ